MLIELKKKSGTPWTLEIWRKAWLKKEEDVPMTIWLGVDGDIVVAEMMGSQDVMVEGLRRGRNPLATHLQPPSP